MAFNQATEWCMELLYLLAGAIFGFMLYKNLSAKAAGEPNRADLWLQYYFGIKGGVSLKLDVLGYRFHMHHWLYLLLISFALPYLLENRALWFALGVCFGGSFQGVHYYDDWIDVISRAH